jgi:hypothetical protein
LAPFALALGSTAARAALELSHQVVSPMNLNRRFCGSIPEHLVRSMPKPDIRWLALARELQAANPAMNRQEGSDKIRER